jgi:hypothetical protein
MTYHANYISEYYPFSIFFSYQHFKTLTGNLYYYLTPRFRSIPRFICGLRHSHQHLHPVTTK